jgi:hypothetical protein
LRTLSDQSINDIVRVDQDGVTVRSHKPSKGRQLGEERSISAATLRNWWDRLLREGTLTKSASGHGAIIRTMLVDCLPNRVVHLGSKTIRLVDGVYAGKVRAADAALPQPAKPGPESPEIDEHEEFLEGRRLLRLHRSRERNRKLVARKKQMVLAATGHLACEACGFDFAAVYGSLGQGFAECHHTLPFAQAAGERRTKLGELVVVCANCHRMLHRRPWHTVAELRALLPSRSGGQRT